jgi:hypothetical protein
VTKEEAKIGMKVHIVGKGNVPFYIVELGKNTAGINASKDAKYGSMGILYERLRKYKKQD